MGALPALQTPVFDIAYLLGIPAPEHLPHEAIIVGRIVARVDTLEPLPVIDENLFEDTPCRQSCCHHQTASLWGSGWCVIGVSTTCRSPNPPHHRPALD